MQWAQGHEMSAKDQARAEMAGDLIALECNDIRSFYGVEEVNNEQ